jgi:predicted subunit of tRNA(5-methylaminomethyl-2-thiouridylate) methyltransferase
VVDVVAGVAMIVVVVGVDVELVVVLVGVVVLDDVADETANELNCTLAWETSSQTRATA